MMRPAFLRNNIQEEKVYGNTVKEENLQEEKGFIWLRKSWDPLEAEST